MQAIRGLVEGERQRQAWIDYQRDVLYPTPPAPEPIPKPSGPSTFLRIVNCLWTVAEDAAIITGDVTAYFIVANPPAGAAGILIGIAGNASKTYHIKVEEDWGFITEEQEREMTAGVGFGYLPFIFGDLVDVYTIGSDFQTWFGYCPTDDAVNEPK